MPSTDRPAGTPGHRSEEWTNRQHQSQPARAESERAREIERSDHEGCHHHGRDEQAHGKTFAQRGIAKQRQPDQRGLGPSLGDDEETEAEQSRDQQTDVARAELTSSNRHRQCIDRDRRGQQHGTHHVEAGLNDLPPLRIGREIPMDERQNGQAQRQIDEKDRLPAER
jgi:hypothetical protein